MTGEARPYYPGVVRLLKAYRAKRGLSQWDASVAAGIHNTLLSKIESGNKPVTATTVKAIERGWELTMSEREQLREAWWAEVV